VRKKVEVALRESPFWEDGTKDRHSVEYEVGLGVSVHSQYKLFGEEVWKTWNDSGVFLECDEACALRDLLCAWYGMPDKEKAPPAEADGAEKE
jgi:hypothetical protein